MFQFDYTVYVNTNSGCQWGGESCDSIVPEKEYCQLAVPPVSAAEHVHEGNCTVNPQMDRKHLEPHMASKSTLTKLVLGISIQVRGNHLNPLQGEPAASGQAGSALFFKHHINLVENVSIRQVDFSGHTIVSCVVFIKKMQHVKVHVGILTSSYCMIIFLMKLLKP